MLATFSFLFFHLVITTRAEINSHKCMEISTFGYSYDALYKLSSHKSSTTNGSSVITFYVKAQSDAHILMTNNPRAIEEIGKYPAVSGPSLATEIVLGGGKNTFSEIRVGTAEKRSSYTFARTPQIVSANEFRGFWIEFAKNGNYAFGVVGNDTRILLAVPNYRDLSADHVTYFGVSTWSHVKGNWKFNCENETEVEKTEDIVYKGVKKLRRDLLSFYDPNVPPNTENVDKPLTLTLSLHVHHFTVKEKSSIIFMSGKMQIKWNDSKLKWDKQEYDNFTSLLVPASNIWTPDVETLSNLAGGLQMDVRSSSVLVASTGNILWQPMFKLTTFCDLEVADWPKDTYDCQLNIGLNPMSFTAWSNIILEMASDDHWDTGNIASDWIITEFTKSTDNWHDFQYLDMHIKFTRKSLAYMTIFSAPFLASSIIILASFWLKHSSPVKLYLRCVSLLLLTVFFIAIGELMPAVSSNVPTIVTFYMLGILLACFAIIHYVIIKNINNFTCVFPKSLQEIFKNSLFQTFFCLPEIDGYEANISKTWILTGITLERLVFMIYVGFYLILWIEIELF